MLHRYWLKLARSDAPTILNIGCGITAHDIEDAKQIFESEIVPIYGAKQICQIIEDVDVSTLDEAHVKPNMGVPSNRGVWFPLLR